MEVAAEPEPESQPSPFLRDLQIHGFVSEGAFLSTANEYIGVSSRGSLKLFEAGVNVSTEVADRLRVGMQIFARDFGRFEDPPRFDWAFLDYRWRSWLGLRAGIVKMPFGLYNEYADIDSARVSILMPQAVYPFRNRDVLLSHRGFALYGEHPIGPAGALEYQAWVGTVSIPENALILDNARLEEIDTKYVAGGQLFWRPPVDNLRIGATLIRLSVDFHIQLPPETVAALIMAGLVPPDYTGDLLVTQRPNTWAVGSAEYSRGDATFAVEYSRAFKRQRSSPMLIPPLDEDQERFYGLAAYRFAPWLELGAYYSVFHADAGDRDGSDPRWAENYHAYQRDLAVSARFDVNPNWLWKAEAHVIDGTADLDSTHNPDPERYWGLFLVRTTVTF